MPRRLRILTAAGVSLLMALVALVVFLLLTLDRASTRIDSQGQAVSALAGAVESERAQIRALGGTPAVPPPQVIISGVAGAPGIQGPGPSDAQVASAVAAYLTAHPVPGVSGEQVAAAVTAYLIATPAPSGPSGPPGPGPSDQQVAEAVASYLQANPPPSGPPGAAGKDGANGSPPAGWTFEANGVTYNCVPDNATPAPHYTCPPQPSPSASPSPSVSPSASASPPATAGPIPSATDSPTPTAAGPTASLPLAFLQPLDPATPRPGAPAGPHSGLLLLAPSYLPLSRRTA